MYKQDPEDARQASENGKKNQEFRELLDCVRIDMRDAQFVGSTSSTSKFNTDNTAEFGAAIVDYFQEQGFESSLDEDGRIHISWENKED